MSGQQLQSRGDDSLGVYGSSMVELVRRAQQAAGRGEFSAPPLGPVGQYVRAAAAVSRRRLAGSVREQHGGAGEARAAGRGEGGVQRAAARTRRSVCQGSSCSLAATTRWECTGAAWWSW
ncbi:hypothetical protein O0L34_g14803 [Tuta absoluta]|nr:hypothetical protein O0L34_g14803 [Tuta absoluta]